MELRSRPKEAAGDAKGNPSNHRVRRRWTFCHHWSLWSNTWFYIRCVSWTVPLAHLNVFFESQLKRKGGGEEECEIREGNGCSGQSTHVGRAHSEAIQIGLFQACLYSWPFLLSLCRRPGSWGFHLFVWFDFLLILKLNYQVRRSKKQCLLKPGPWHVLRTYLLSSSDPQIRNAFSYYFFTLPEAWSLGFLASWLHSWVRMSPGSTGRWHVVGAVQSYLTVALGFTKCLPLQPACSFPSLPETHQAFVR